MARKTTKPKPEQGHDSPETVRGSGITRIMVRDFKSLAGEHSIEVRPLTILAGANSSGKSSIMQPLLLMKQTLEETYNPGALLLEGPNVRFTKSEQLIAKVVGRPDARSFAAGLLLADTSEIVNVFSKDRGSRTIDVESTSFRRTSFKAQITPDSHYDELFNIIKRQHEKPSSKKSYSVYRDRCFLYATVELRDTHLGFDFERPLFNLASVIEEIESSIHVPGLRGNPQRTYPFAAPGPSFPGTFEKYAASLIYSWGEYGPSALLLGVAADMKRLGLTWKVVAKPIGETQFELQVGRLQNSARGGAQDLVNIADVGFGVSQTIPIVVAVHAAQPGQLVYIEQPEIHLHPRAQTAMAQVLANAAMRGVRLVIETHSDLLILGIQTLIAEGKLPPELVILHWFERDEDGLTKISTAGLDRSGAFDRDWPEDFGDVQMKAQSRYLDAAELWSEGE